MTCSSMDSKKPSKPVLRMCKLISRFGKLLRKSDHSKKPDHLKITCCLEETSPSLPIISEPISINLPSHKFLNIPALTITDQYLGGSPLSSPLTPRVASYPPTPDYIKHHLSQGEEYDASVSFFPSNCFTGITSDELETRDWAIDYSDLEIGCVIQKNSSGEIHRGRWHGNVLIFRNQDENSVGQFMVDVENYSKIRHENVLLFLGASVDNSEELSIVMQPPKQQESLHQVLSSPRRLNKLPHTLKWSIAHQMAQAVSYLHAKGVYVGPALHSGNIFLESKIKLSLVDFGFGTDMFSRQAPRNNLASFLAPELLAIVSDDTSTFQTSPLKLHCNEASDSYAFGSLLYEVFTESCPFKNLSCLEIIDIIRSGTTGKLLERPEIPPTIQKIISQCWSHVPQSRPSFSQILDSSLKRKAFMLSRHNSEPDKLDMVALSHSRSFA